MTGPPAIALDRALPRWWADRAWSFNDVVTIVDVNYTTAFRWFQLIRAAGLFFGEKRGRDWHLDAHELYIFRLLAAFQRAGIPAGPAHVRAVLGFAYGPDGAPVAPDVDFVMRGPASQFRIDAPAIFRAVVDATDPKHEENHARYH